MAATARSASRVCSARAPTCREEGGEGGETRPTARCAPLASCVLTMNSLTVAVLTVLTVLTVAVLTVQVRSFGQLYTILKRDLQARHTK